MEQSTQVSSVDDLTPWAVGKYVFISASCTGGVGLRYFIICKLSHLEVASKRIYACALDVDVDVNRASVRLSHSVTLVLCSKAITLRSVRLIAQSATTHWFFWTILPQAFAWYGCKYTQEISIFSNTNACLSVCLSVQQEQIQHWTSSTSNSLAAFPSSIELCKT